MSKLLAPLLLLSLICAPAIARERAWIEESRVIYPKKTEHFVLGEVSFDKKQVAVGVGLHYKHADHPDVGIDLFIYPAGAMPEAYAVKTGFDDMKDSIKLAEQYGRYENVHFGEEHDVDLPQPEAVPDEESGLAFVPVPHHGRSLAFDYTSDSVRFQSRALLFYRYDYWIKLRASTDAFEDEKLDAVVADALPELIRDVRVRSRGACKPPSQKFGISGSQEPLPADVDPVSLDGERILMYVKEPQEETAKKMLTAIARRLENGCVANFRVELAKPQKDEAYTTIKFPKDAWTAQKPPSEG